MTKHEFISKLLSLFTYITSKDEYGSFYDSYSRILTNKIDYDKLWDLYSQNFGKYPPTAKELKDISQQCYLENILKKENQMLHIKIYNPRYKNICSDVFPVNASDEIIIKTYENKFNIKGFEIISKEIK